MGDDEPASPRGRSRLDLVEVDREGETTYALAPDVGAPAAAEPDGTVRLLPAFDPYVGGALSLGWAG